MSTRGTLRLAVLVSGSGSNLQALIDAIESQELTGVEIALVVSNRADAQGVQRALKHRIPTIYLPWKVKEEGEERLASLLALFHIDVIVLAGWMRILTPNFISRYPHRILNLHPALLPERGQGDTVMTSDGSIIPVFRGLHVVQHALDAGVPVTGSTVHYVIPDVDAGPMLIRAEVSIQEGDTEETLHERIKAVEHKLIVEAVRMVRDGMSVHR